MRPETFEFETLECPKCNSKQIRLWGLGEPCDPIEENGFDFNATCAECRRELRFVVLPKHNGTVAIECDVEPPTE